MSFGGQMQRLMEHAARTRELEGYRIELQFELKALDITIRRETRDRISTQAVRIQYADIADPDTVMDRMNEMVMILKSRA